MVVFDPVDCKHWGLLDTVVTLLFDYSQQTKLLDLRLVVIPELLNKFSDLSSLQSQLSDFVVDLMVI